MWRGDTWWPPVCCLVRFPRCAFCTMRRNMTTGLLNLSPNGTPRKLQALGSWHPQFPLFSSTHGRQQDPRCRAAGEGSWWGTHGTRTDGRLLPAGTAQIYGKLSQRHSTDGQSRPGSKEGARGVRAEPLRGAVPGMQKGDPPSSRLSRSPASRGGAPRPLRPLHQEPVAQLERKRPLQEQSGEPLG